MIYGTEGFLTFQEEVKEEFLQVPFKQKALQVFRIKWPTEF